MKVYYHVSGGLLGLDDSITLDTLSMKKDESLSLEDLVAKSNFFSLPSDLTGPPPKGSADFMTHKIVVEKDYQTHTVRTNDKAMPDSLKQLISFLHSKLEIV